MYLRASFGVWASMLVPWYFFTFMYHTSLAFLCYRLGERDVDMVFLEFLDDCITVTIP